MALTSDPDDPALTHGIDAAPGPQAEVYLVLRPMYRAYRHHIHGCGAVTRMELALALSEDNARQPGFYGATYCCGCQMHRPVGAEGEFTWVDGDRRDTGIRVGT